MKSNSALKELSIASHRKLRGKIGIVSKAPLRSQNDLKIYYTPGVGAVAAYLATHKKEARDLTMKGNAVAVISDGSRVLGLGNIGPEAALPVMEGKAMIFKEFAGIDAFPIVLDTQDVGEIVKTIRYISPAFGAINLEDIAAPRCFEIEKQLQKILPLFVMHDDQHATAIAVLAGLINAFKVVKKNLKTSKIVVIGAGAAGSATAKLLVAYGARNVVVVDEKGILSAKRKGLNLYQKELAAMTNKKNVQGTLQGALLGADAMVGLSAPNIVKSGDVKRMAVKSIVFALANPVPEIMPQDAKVGGAFIVATGRSDFENQVNNALVFPGVFRGALDHRVKKITWDMKIRAAKVLASLVKKPTPRAIVPSVFDPRVVKALASVIQ
ncbi:MAG: NADP-dependent malic enzyme [bacterium]|nr:NADP-dependent malic enzyme [bacterium]